MDTAYHVPVSLTVISSVFLGIGAICMIINSVDILWRRGWRSMMAIMIPVWPINATYIGPLTLYLYFKYGRPTKPSYSGGDHGHSALNLDQHPTTDHGNHHAEYHQDTAQNHGKSSHGGSPSEDTEKQGHQMDHSMMHHDMTGDRPMWVTVFIGVSHCGAGCVLGDIVGEWLVYGTGATINGYGIWVELLVDYGFALLFGIVFQYWSIAPMSGNYGPKTVFRAMKADILSLTSFELGLFGWMVAYQVGIWGYRLEMNTATYWWMMQVGMFFGFWTAVPVNWWLIKNKIKEPCA